MTVPPVGVVDLIPHWCGRSAPPVGVVGLAAPGVVDLVPPCSWRGKSDPLQLGVVQMDLAPPVRSRPTCCTVSDLQTPDGKLHMCDVLMR